MLDPLRRGHEAPAPRTLIDILNATAAAHPTAVAIDSGAEQLSYAELRELVMSEARRLHDHGVRRGDRVGIRIPSGTTDLYVAILAILRAGAAYVPVDADDPDERAELVFGEAGVAAVVGADLVITASEVTARRRDESTRGSIPAPELSDDAWIIFTSGSTGTPKGVAVTHRSAAAFVDAESQMFLVDDPLHPGDRVLAGLSVAFDASCEEMWLAWRYGATLVPAPRSLVRSGLDLGPWLVAQRITVVSTVPTLAALWPDDALDEVRLLIFGGEACPPELADRLAVEGREVWNTYGPTEATVVACGAQMHAGQPVRIGLPLAGWDLAVVDGDGAPVAPGATGELIIGGVGLARYLDPAKDAEKYAPMPTLGWDRAYRSGDLVSFDGEGLLFAGRADEQVKLGGRRIELGEVDSALQGLPGVLGAAAAVKTTASGTQVLVGYLAPAPGADLDLSFLADELRTHLPAALVPRLAIVDTLPTRTSGKVDRDALPWPLPGAGAECRDEDAQLTPGAEQLAAVWETVLGVAPTHPDDDFFELGGSSLGAAQLVSRLRALHPTVTVADLYAHPRLGGQAAFLAIQPGGHAADAPRPAHDHPVRPVPRAAQLAQVLIGIPLRTITGLQWLTIALLTNNLLTLVSDAPWLRPVNWWGLTVAALALLTPWGRMALTALGTRLLLAGIRPGTYPRGGSVHLRHWTAEHLALSLNAMSMAAAPWVSTYARLLGAQVGREVNLHTVPPITGWMTLGDRVSIEPEVDLTGAWVDGDQFILGPVHVGTDASVGARSTLAPGARIGRGTAVAPGSCVRGEIGKGETWSGSPAVRISKRRKGWPEHQGPTSPRWVAVYAVSAVLLSLLPFAALVPGVLLTLHWLRDDASWGAMATTVAMATPLVALSAFVLLAGLTIVAIRLLGMGLSEGFHPVRSRIGWQVWASERVLDQARTYLYPLYASLATPTWLRLLGAQVGRNVEASTVLLLPRMTTIADGAFLADDTLIASYEMAEGWVRIERAKIGRRAFLGNSGMTAPGRRVPKDGLVAVLSAAPAKSKKGTSWLGSPPVRLRRTAADVDLSRTFEPPARLRLLRGAIEWVRGLAVVLTIGLAGALLVALQWALVNWGLWWTAVVSGLLLMAVGALAAGIALLAKWLLVGRIDAQEQPLWSSFVWRNELADAFLEMVAGPWFVWPALGSPSLVAFMRAMGAKLGRGVWLESYWLPETDLVTLGAGATVNRGCVVQTHLFHDRIMQLDEVILRDGATLGPNSIILPAATIGAQASVGGGSLVLRGETVPDASRWTGNPIAPA